MCDHYIKHSFFKNGDSNTICDLGAGLSLISICIMRLIIALNRYFINKSLIFFHKSNYLRILLLLLSDACFKVIYCLQIIYYFSAFLSRHFSLYFFNIHAYTHISIRSLAHYSIHNLTYNDTILCEIYYSLISFLKQRYIKNYTIISIINLQHIVIVTMEKKTYKNVQKV